MKGRRVIYLLAAVAAVAAAMVLPGTASATTVVCSGTTLITQNTTLTSDYDCSGLSATAFEITKPGVTLDLGGHTITGNSSYDVVVADSTCTNSFNSDTNCDNATVTDGTISGGYDQIDFWGNNDTASNLKLTGAAHNGVYLNETSGAAVLNNTISDAARYGVYGSYAASSGIMSNVIVDAYYEAIYLEYDQGDNVEGNTTSENLGNTTNVYSNAENIEDYESPNQLYYGNTTTGGTYGIDTEPTEYGAVTVADNGVRSASDTGIYLYEGYAWTSEYGKGPVSLVSGNIATGNDVGYEDGDYSYDAIWQNNLANRNTSDGFEFYYSGGAFVTGNTAQYNGGDGFYIYDADATDYPLAAFSGNNAWYNQGYGFYSDYAIAGSGNNGASGGAATNNGGDCYQVSGCG